MQASKPRVNPIYPAPPGATEKPPDLGPPVRGWLLYYCISRTILGPVYLLLTRHTIHGMRWIVFSVALTCVGAIGGAAVWRRWNHVFLVVAVDLALRTLDIFIIVWFWWRPIAAHPGRSWVVLLFWVWALGWILAWFLYFKRSRRVFQTLGRNL